MVRPSVSDSDRLQLAGVAAAVTAVLLVAVKVISLTTLGDQVSSWHQKISYVTQSDEVLGGFTLFAALLLMLDSEKETLAAKLSILVTSVIAAVLMLAAVYDVASQFINYDSSYNTRQQLLLLINWLPQLVLGSAALWLTWPVGSQIRTANETATNNSEEDETPDAD